MKSYPTHWQKKIMWAALTYLSVVAIGSFSIGLVVLVANALNFLQPLLAPVALAAVLAYLLEPLVARIMKLGTTRIFAVSLVFATFILAAVLIIVWIVPTISAESAKFARDVPEYADKAQEWLFKTMSRFQQSRYIGPVIQNAANWIEGQVPLIASNIWLFIQKSAGGFLGIFGILFGLILVPIILFYFLKDGPTISDHWTDYVPLRASHFKDEVVDVLTEINDYLIAFFRGQLLVSIADGILTGIALLIMGLDFALLIGLLICVLALIPYIGITICWIPAVLIAAMQWNDWLHPLIVTIIFIVVQQVEGWLIAPRIVGNSVGLHPLTVIVAVFGWSLLIGGLLGAILAVPLTATIKVLLHRYVWQRQFKAATLSRNSLDEPQTDPLSAEV
jgi:predicted PurR-regulated permease PerM